MPFNFNRILVRTSTQYKLWFMSRHNGEILMTKISLTYAVFIFLIQAYLVSAQAATKQVTLMTYNVENLFDLKHDQKKNDYAYMPYIEKRNNKRHTAVCEKMTSWYYKNECMFFNWNEPILEEKMLRLSEVILQDGKGPDILFLQEVENISVLEQLRRDYLDKAGYKKSILLEGPDNRGIDTAILSKLPVVGKPKLHKADLKRTGPLKDWGEFYPTRSVLEATFKLPNGDLLTAISIHLPSQSDRNHPEMRRQILEQVNKIKLSLPKDRFVVVGGDFNITEKEERELQPLKKTISNDFYISHKIGCKTCKGTYYYRTKRTWSFFDILLFSKNFGSRKKGSWYVSAASIKVANEVDYQNSRKYKKDGIPAVPAKYTDQSYKYRDGVSDHWPMVATIKLRAK